MVPEELGTRGLGPPTAGSLGNILDEKKMKEERTNCILRILSPSCVATFHTVDCILICVHWYIVYWYTDTLYSVYWYTVYWFIVYLDSITDTGIPVTVYTTVASHCCIQVI